MGHHKHNPTAIAAKNGELPPKKRGMTKRQREALFGKLIEDRTGITKLRRVAGLDRYY